PRSGVPALSRWKMVDNLRAVLTRAGFAEPELKVLRGIISSLDRFSPAMPRGDGSPGDDPRRLPAAAARARKAEAGQAPNANGDDNDAPLGGKGTDND
ncbi:RNA methyltransferase, partial [Mesorhizobium sp. M4B.F.Ca.ET.013.02.1.1]